MFGLGRRRAGKAAEESEDELHAGGPDPAEEQGPFDAGDAPEDGVERLDLGSVRVPVPEGGQLQVEVDPSGPVRAVHMVTGAGRLTVSAFAAPRSGGLWSDVREELADQLRKDGAQVHTEGGDWGAELVADSPKAALRFVGVDGPRWLLRGVAAGPSDNAAACTDLLYQVIDKTVVVRGEDPMPVRTPLPIELPDEIMRHIQNVQEQEQSEAGSQAG